MGLFAQPLGPAHQVVAYLSKHLNLIVRGWPACLWALALAALLTKEALKLTLQLPVTVFSAHHLKDLLGAKTLPLLSPSQIKEIHLLFMKNRNITLAPTPPLNLASLLSTPKESNTTHSCLKLLIFICLLGMACRIKLFYQLISHSSWMAVQCVGLMDFNM